MSTTPNTCPFCSSPHFTFTGSIDLPQFQCQNCNSQFGFPDNRETRKRSSKKLASLFGNILGNIVICTIVVTGLIIYYIAIPLSSYVEDISMEPTFVADDYFVSIPLHFQFQYENLRRGQILTIYGLKPGVMAFKRVIGLPGEEVQLTNGRLFINGSPVDESYLTGPTYIINDGPVKLGPREYYVLGDNRLYSLDSTEQGPITQDQIGDRVFLHLDLHSEDIPFYQRLKTK